MVEEGQSHLDQLEDLFKANHENWRGLKRRHQKKKMKAYTALTAKVGEGDLTGLSYEEIKDTLARFIAVYEDQIKSFEDYENMDADQKEVYQGRAIEFLQAIARDKQVKYETLIEEIQDEGITKMLDSYSMNKAGEEERSLRTSHLHKIYDPMNGDQHEELTDELRERDGAVRRKKRSSVRNNIEDHLRTYLNRHYTHSRSELSENEGVQEDAA